MSYTVYEPDAWVVLRIQLADEVIYKVIGGWYGGYLHGDSWRMNSGIVSVEENEDYYSFKGFSGSTYKCHKGSERTTGLTGMVISKLQDDASERDASVEIVYAKHLDMKDASA